VAAQLAEGATPPATGEVPVDALLGWMKRNKYPVMAAAEKAPLWLDDEPAYQEALSAEIEWYATQRVEYLRVRDAWLEQGIPCLMFKSAGNAPSFPHLSDNLDLWVRPEHGRAARDTLQRLGYVELRNVEEPQKYLYRKFRGGRCVAAIHVHELVAWFVGFMDEEALERRMRQSVDDAAVNIPSPEDVILINLAHACYENKKLRFNDLVRVRTALQDTAGAPDWAYMEGVARSRGWIDGLAFMVLVYAALEPSVFGSGLVSPQQQERFEAIVRAEERLWRRLQEIRSIPEIDLPLDLSYWFCKWLYYRKILGDPARKVSSRWRDAALTLVWGVKLKSGLKPQPGMIVSLSGADGSGKSAQARALLDALRTCDIQHDYLWSRGGSSGIVHRINSLRRTLKGRSSAGESSDSLDRRRGRLASPPLRFAWSWLVAADQIVSYVLRAALPAALGRVVMCDRYAYDTAVEMDASLPKDARWSRLAIAALLALTPRPRLGYVFDVSLETARARKPDEAFHADREAERAAYAAIAERYGLRLRSTEGAFADSNDPLVREVIDEYMDNFETWLNAVFLSNPSQRNRADLAWSPGAAQ
jgi:dTMP kinase